MNLPTPVLMLLKSLGVKEEKIKNAVTEINAMLENGTISKIVSGAQEIIERQKRIEEKLDELLQKKMERKCLKSV